MARATAGASARAALTVNSTTRSHSSALCWLGKENRRLGGEVPEISAVFTTRRLRRSSWEDLLASSGLFEVYRSNCFSVWAHGAVGSAFP